MANLSKPSRYRSQLLRMWVEETTDRMPVWRFSLEDVETGTRNGFADLDALIYHLLDLMEELSTVNPEEYTKVSTSKLD